MKTERTYRRIVVAPANSWREAIAILVFVAALLLAGGLRVWILSGSQTPLFMEPYHRLDTSLNDTERLLYQDCLASDNDIVALWQEKGKWPTIDALDEEGIPPFAVDLLPRLLANFKWTAYDRGPWVDYLGLDSENKKMPSVILRVIDLHAGYHPHPHPGVDYDPNQKVAVQVWMHRQSGQSYVGMQLIQNGWLWVVSPDAPFLKVPNKLKKTVKNSRFLPKGDR